MLIYGTYAYKLPVYYVGTAPRYQFQLITMESHMPMLEYFWILKILLFIFYFYIKIIKFRLFFKL